MSEINYPWTLLLPLGFLISLVGGAFSSNSRLIQGSIVLLLFVNCFYVGQFAKPSEYVNRGDGFYFTNDATTTSSRELMPLWVKSFPSSRPSQKVEVIAGAGNVRIHEDRSQRTVFTADLTTDSLVRLNTIYFPGWQWEEGDRLIPFTYNNPLGVMESRLPKGSHLITASLQNTFIRTVGNTTSLVSFVILCLLWGTHFQKKKQHHEKK